MDLQKYKKTGVLSLDQDDMNDPGTMLAMNKLMNDAQDEMIKQVQVIQEKYNLTEEYALAVWYLRTRSRWTQRLEDKLIQMCRNGEPCPNMSEWPPEELRVKNQKEMFESALLRPRGYDDFSPEIQWHVDKMLGILDWNGGCPHQDRPGAENTRMCQECLNLYRNR